MNFLIQEKDHNHREYINKQKNLCNEIKSLTDNIKLKIEKIEKNTLNNENMNKEEKKNCFLSPTPAGVTGSRMDRNTLQWSGSLRSWWR